MSRDYKTYLEDALDASRKIQRYCVGLSQDDFVDDEKTFDAVLRNLEVIGEAVKQIPDDVRAAAPHVEWRKIAGLRDILIHEYFAVDAEIIWDVVHNKLPELERQLDELLRQA